MAVFRSADEGRPRRSTAATHTVSESFVQHRYRRGLADGVDRPRWTRAVGAVSTSGVDVWATRSQNPARWRRLVFSASDGCGPKNKRPSADRRRRRWVRPGSRFVGRRGTRSPSSWLRTCSTRRSSGPRTDAEETSSRRRTRARRRVDATMSVDDRRDHPRACDISAHFDDSGAFPMPGGSSGTARRPMLFTGPYKVQHLGWSSTTVYTKHVPAAPRTAARG